MTKSAMVTEEPDRLALGFLSMWGSPTIARQKESRSSTWSRLFLRIDHVRPNL